MSKKTSYLLGILLTIIIGTFLYNKYCCNCDCKDKNETVSGSITDGKSDLTLNKFNLTGEGFNYQTNDNFKFLKNNFNTITPVSDSIDLGLQNLKSFFEKNPEQKLLITGYANADEKNNSAYPNLGFARANDIKNYFVSKGMTSSQFEINGEIKDSLMVKMDTLIGPASYKIFKQDATKKVDWNALKNKINGNPLTLYFNTGQAEINLTAEERQKVADLVNYLDNVPNSKLSIIGHTDNVGNRDTNIRLGLERANFAKEYLSKNGVTLEKMESSSKGPDEPIADNSTAEGKSKNRRTVVTIK